MSTLHEAVEGVMHGDWFNSNKGTCRINEIKLHTAIVELSEEAYADGAESSYEMDFEYDLKPIPLTTDLFFANGFKLMKRSKKLQRKDGLTCYWWKKKTYGKEDFSSVQVWFSEDESVDGIYIYSKIGYEVEYGRPENLTVHEFQHALRLMGLDELADNFTLTKKNHTN